MPGCIAHDIFYDIQPKEVTTQESSYKYKPSGSPSLFVFMTLSLADLKSAICTLILRSLSAIKPASEQMALISAPERSSFWLMNSSSSTSSFKDILEVCSVKILRLVFSDHHVSQCRVSTCCGWDDLRSGFSKRIFLSILPGRMRAGSNVSILFVAMITLTSPRSSNPSN